MSKKDWKRARSSVQIEQRVQAILDAASNLFQQVPYESVTMQMIAKEAGFTRSNLYRYFSTREEIFLALFMSDVDSWGEQIFASFTQEESPETFVRKWTEIVCRQQRLLELFPLLSLSLEKNTSEETYRNAKQTFAEKTDKLIAALRNVLPSLSAEQWAEFLLTNEALIAGAWPMTQYSDMQRQVLDDPALSHFKIDFVPFYEKALLMYLRGVTAENIQTTRESVPEPEPESQLAPELERGLEHIDEIRATVTRIWEHISVDID